MVPLLPHRQACAYIRVSTDKQGQSGQGLEGQIASITRAAELWGIHIVEWYQDVASGRHSDSLGKRDGVQRAIRHAQALKMPILVDGLDRLSRDMASVEKLVSETRIEIISAKEGSLADPVTLASRAARAEREGDLISENTRRSLEAKKAQGVRLGNPTNLPEAQRKGAKSNADRAAAQVKVIAGELDRLEAWSMKVPQIVELLNQAGSRTSRGLPWTNAALRPVLKKAKALRAPLQFTEVRATTDEDCPPAYNQNTNFGRF
ncbi:MAG: hypothetical protein DI549_16200 [Ancylobacter novellus]|uniref:Resolvase/invertase-type recombinase catalytic domain-containing protein n=1 Tax=Ancylobacter novellus TaxID=921 RepID=A0A2W5QUE6_ANCNO|nr:MAG: hypothetical protein DI549_16200 [Ancylobacter novellus]